jgi:hypothetical protein
MGAHDGSALRGAGMWTTPDVCSGARDMSKIDPAAQRRADTKRTTGLPTEAAYWKTPSVSNSQGDEYTRDRGQPGMERLTLTGQAQHWPTPTASLVNDGEDPASWNARREKQAARLNNGNGMGMPLTQAAQQWPTPASRDFRTPNSAQSQATRQHTGNEQLPNFVEHHFLRPALSIHDGRELSPTARTLPRRLNPAFACWLMGWPIWWTNPALTSCAKSAMESYRCRLQWHLSNLCGGRGEIDE